MHNAFMIGRKLHLCIVLSVSEIFPALSEESLSLLNSSLKAILYFDDVNITLILFIRVFIMG